MDWASLVMKGFALLGMLTFVFYAGKLGIGPLWTKLVGAAGVAKADFVALEERVKGLEAHTGLPLPPKPPAVPPAAAPTA